VVARRRNGINAEFAEEERKRERRGLCVVEGLPAARGWWRIEELKINAEFAEEERKRERRGLCVVEGLAGLVGGGREEKTHPFLQKVAEKGSAPLGFWLVRDGRSCW